MEKLLEEFPEIHCEKLLKLYNVKAFVNHKKEIHKYIKEYENLYNMSERLEHKESEKILNILEDHVSRVISKLLLLDVMKIFRHKFTEYANIPDDTQFKFNETTFDLYMKYPDKKLVKVESFRKHFLEYIKGK